MKQCDEGVVILRPWQLTLVVALIGNAVIGLILAGLAARDYAYNLSGIVAVLLWATTGATNGVAAWACLRARPWFLAPTVVGQAMSLFLATYVLLADIRSGHLSLVVDAVACAVLVVAIVTLVNLVPFVPGRFGTIWKGVAALFPLIGLFQVWLQTWYLPNNARPQVDVKGTLTQVGATDDLIRLKSTVTLHNRGSVQAEIVGSLQRVTLLKGGLPLSVATDPTAISGAFDWTDPNAAAYRPRWEDVQASSPSRVLAVDEITPLRDFLLPGQTWSSDALIDVPRGKGDGAELRVQIALITNRRIGDPRTCHGRQLPYTDEEFIAEARLPVAAVGGGSFLCVQADLRPSNVVASLVNEAAVVRTYIVLDEPAQSSRARTVPYLLNTYRAESSLDAPSADAVRDAQRVDANNPSAVMDVSTVVAWDEAGNSGMAAKPS